MESSGNAKIIDNLSGAGQVMITDNFTDGNQGCPGDAIKFVYAGPSESNCGYGRPRWGLLSWRRFQGLSPLVYDRRAFGSQGQHNLNGAE